MAQDCAGFQAADLDGAGESMRKGWEQPGRAAGDLKDLRERGYCAAHLGDQAAMCELAAFGRPVVPEVLGDGRQVSGGPLSPPLFQPLLAYLRAAGR